jgi:NDP-sugar pyrophosphorylase family protein
MKIIIPMAGTGNRFVERGYVDPKPLIRVNGKRIIEYILDMFDHSDDFVFICNETHLAETKMREILLELKPNARIVSMPQHKLGPVWTVKAAYDLIDDNDQVIVSYCDNPHRWDRKHFEQTINNYSMDGCILTHTGFHPHTLANTKMAFVRDIANTPFISEIKEKACYTDNPMSEHASTGVYYFKSGKALKHYFDLALENNITFNGEYYVTLVYNLLIQDSLRVGYYDTPFVTVFGTPEEVENFEAWATILKQTQVKTEEDLVHCYHYWKQYHDNSR